MYIILAGSKVFLLHAWPENFVAKILAVYLAQDILAEMHIKNY